MTLQSNTFESPYELTEFVNMWIAPNRENIEAITAAEINSEYREFTTYTLFWWMD